MIAKDNRRVKFGPITQILYDGSLSLPNPEQYYCSLFLHPELLARQKQEQVNVETAVTRIGGDQQTTIDVHLKWADFATEVIRYMLPKLSQKSNHHEDFKEFGYKVNNCIFYIMVKNFFNFNFNFNFILFYFIFFFMFEKIL